MKRQKTFKDRPKIASNSTKLTGTDKSPMDVDAGRDTSASVPVEEGDDDEVTAINLQDVPEAEPEDSSNDDDAPRRSKRKRAESVQQDNDMSEDKKLGFTTTYEGFSIWGWILCLLVARKNRSEKRADADSNQALMEEWICTQAPQEYDES